MSDHKRKGNTHVATEDNLTTKTSKLETSKDVKSGMVMSTTIPNFECAQFFQKLIFTKAMNIKTRDQVIFSAQKTDNLCLVFKGLSDKRFLSVPVFTQTNKTKWYGFVELSDIVHYVTQHFSDKLNIETDFWKLAEQEEKFKALTVKDVMGYPHTRENKFNPITQDYSLFSAFEVFARDPNIHRIPILDNMQDRKLLSIITQSQLIKYVYDNLALLGGKKDILVKNMNYPKTVVTVKSTDLAIDAFKKLDEWGVNGVGIVNEQGQLIDTLSVRDLKGMAYDGSLFWKLYKPVDKFLEYMKNDSFDVSNLRPRSVVWALENDTFESVLTKIYTNQIHRLFIVDSIESKKPIGIICLSDLLRQLFN